jgi:hypothetical protein
MSHRIRRVQQLAVAPAPLVGRFGLFAERLEVHTNDPRILAAAAASFGRFEVPESGKPLVVRLVVGDGEPGRAGTPPVRPDTPEPQPATQPATPPATPPGPLDARDLAHETAGHLFSITLGTAGRAAVDVATGYSSGTVSAALAATPGLLRYAFVEAMAQAMLTGGRGYVPVHASCVVHGGVGIVLQGPAGAGKSTLALACARRGWGLLAEDVVFARPVDGPGAGGSIELWGMPWTQRLLPDAPRFFPELGEAKARLQANGEHKLEIDLDDHAPGAATPRAAAGPVVLLARDSGGRTRAEWLTPGDAPAEVEVLWPWEGGWTAARQGTAERLLDGGLIRLHVNGTPDEAIDALEGILAAPPDRTGTAQASVASHPR